MSPIQILEPLIFIALTIIAVGFVIKRGKIISKTIQLGRNEELKGPKSARWKNVFLLALGQQKMFRKPGVAILHLIVYAGLIIINIEIVEIILDAGTQCKSTAGIVEISKTPFEVSTTK